MTRLIIAAVVAGVLAGHWLVPDNILIHTNTIITVGLCVLLFLVGIDIGKQQDLVTMMKKSGAAILIVPFMTIIGTVVGTGLVGYLMGMVPTDAVAVGSGLAWYTLAPMLIAEYSAELSAMSFMSNVFRELGAVLIVPIVASKIGYLEAVSLGGAASMDVLLPVVERATDSRIAVYSFISGVLLSIAVPGLVTFFITI